MRAENMRGGRRRVPSRSVGSSSSRNDNGRRTERRQPRNGRMYCHCELPCVGYTSTRPWSYGKIFWRCCKWNTPNSCGFFKWLDDVNGYDDDITEVQLPDEEEGINKMNEELLELLQASMKKNEKLQKKLGFLKE